MGVGIKALFIDLDGTLLTSKKEVTDVSFATLEKCKAKGIKLFMATGRSPRSLERSIFGRKILNLFDGGVLCNGGYILLNGEATFSYVSDDVGRKVVELVNQYEDVNIALHLESHGEKWALRFPLTEHGLKLWGLLPTEYCQLDAAKDLETVKILVFSGQQMDWRVPLDEGLIKKLQMLCHDKAQLYPSDKGTVVTITAKGATKVTGIEEVRNKLRLGKHELAVFGDDFNDLEMMAAFPNSIAMGNAEDAVKSAAKFVTLDNDSDGIHHAITNILGLV